MTFEGRIVGVRMSKSLNVGYTFQPERIVGIQEVEAADREFILERVKNEKKRYPLVDLAFPFKVGSIGCVSDLFSIGYLLMERKETIQIQCGLKKESSVFIGTVDSFCVGEETGTKVSQSEGATSTDSESEKKEENGDRK